MMSNNTELTVPQDYEQSSKYFRHYWSDIQETADLAKKEMINMVTALEKAGFTRTQAIQKIVDDHKDLNGFSRRTIYRGLPDNQKRKYDFTNVKSNVPDDTFENKNTETVLEEDNNNNERVQPISELEEFRQEKGKQIIDNVETYEDNVSEPIINQSFQFRTMLSIKDQEIPVIVTVYPNKKTGYVEVDEKLARKLKGF
jgi:hypothetical protein